MNSEDFESYLVIDLPILVPISIPLFGTDDITGLRNSLDFDIDIHIKLSGKFFINLFILAVQPLLLYIMLYFQFISITEASHAYPKN